MTKEKGRTKKEAERRQTCSANLRISRCGARAAQTSVRKSAHTKSATRARLSAFHYGSDRQGFRPLGAAPGQASWEAIIRELTKGDSLLYGNRRLKDRPNPNEHNPHLPLETAGAGRVSGGQAGLMEAGRYWRAVSCAASLGMLLCLGPSVAYGLALTTIRSTSGGVSETVWELKTIGGTTGLRETTRASYSAMYADISTFLLPLTNSTIASFSLTDTPFDTTVTPTVWPPAAIAAGADISVGGMGDIFLTSHCEALSAFAIPIANQNASPASKYIISTGNFGLPLSSLVKASKSTDRGASCAFKDCISPSEIVWRASDETQIPPSEKSSAITPPATTHANMRFQFQPWGAGNHFFSLVSARPSATRPIPITKANTTNDNSLTDSQSSATPFELGIRGNPERKLQIMLGMFWILTTGVAFVCWLAWGVFCLTTGRWRHS